MAEHYYTVGKHGAPTPETAPHGYKWRLDGPWICSGGPYEWHPENQWWPLPAPPTEEAPAPEPVARWTGMFGESCGFIAYDEDTLIPLDVVDRACDALNTLDANGVAWGPGRPMSELPDDGLVLVQMSSGVPYTFYIRKADYIATHRNTYECWWPLPEVTP